MGIASQDLTGDGLPEVFLTSQGDNKLQTLAARGPASRPTRTSRIWRRGDRPPPLHRRRRAAVDGLASTEFADVNNDGVADLFIAKGNVEAEGLRDPRPEQPVDRAAVTARSSSKARRAAGSCSFERARGAAVVDLNLDGMLDHRRQPLAHAGVAVAQRRSRRCRATRADGHRGRAVRLHQAGPNRDAIGAGRGAVVTARPSTRSPSAGGTPAGSSADPRRARRRRPGGGPRPVARRRDRPVDDPVDAGRSRRSKGGDAGRRVGPATGDNARRIGPGAVIEIRRPMRAPGKMRAAGHWYARHVRTRGPARHRDPRLHVAAVIIDPRLSGRSGSVSTSACRRSSPPILTCASASRWRLTFRAERGDHLANRRDVDRQRGWRLILRPRHRPSDVALLSLVRVVGDDRRFSLLTGVPDPEAAAPTCSTLVEHRPRRRVRRRSAIRAP